MVEILIRIEGLCLESPSAVLLGCGLVVLILGVLLWLGGSHFSAVLLGLLGAVGGASCGLYLSQSLNAPSFISMSVGAVVFMIAAVLLRNALIVLLAILVFALAGGTAYSSLILEETPSKSYSSFQPSVLEPFSQMDTSTRLAYVHQITENGENFVERMGLLIHDTFETMDPYKWKILLFALGGGLTGLVLIWSIKNMIIILCYSGVGALLVLIGLEICLLGLNIHLISWFQSRQSALSITYLNLVAMGMMYQFTLERSSKKKHGNPGYGKVP
jgi:hypothetical protein